MDFLEKSPPSFKNWIGQKESMIFLLPKIWTILRNVEKFNRQFTCSRLLPFIFKVILVVIFSCIGDVLRAYGVQDGETALASSASEVPKTSPTAGVVEPKSVKTPIERHILAPEIRYQGIDGRSRLFEPGSYRFSVLIISASWNKESEKLWAVMSKKEIELTKRGIGVLFLFSHDSLEGLKQFVKKISGNFLVGLDKNDFIEKLINPKVPTIFVINHKNEFVMRKELPSALEQEEVISKFLLWTDF